MRKILIVLIAMLIAAPLLAACGAPIDPYDRPLGDRMCTPAPQTGC